MTSLNTAGAYAGPIVAGIGCTSSATADEIIHLLETTLLEAGLAEATLLAMASHSRKRASGALAEAAARLCVPLRFPADAGMGGNTSVCEGAAGAYGPLLVGKRKSARVTCAISMAVQSPSAAMASSTVVTSWAGP